jgi:trans-aconitate 2-methyltransferase
LAASGGRRSVIWDPARYLRFGADRRRPALDLLARIPDVAAERIWDLGCGTGSVTPFLAARWPKAAVFGLDSSPEMLEAARKIDGITWVEGDIAEWEPPEPADIAYANASLHWVDDHDRLFPKLMRGLRPGGVLAVQMPRNFEEPSHRVLYETARTARWAPRVGRLADWHPVDPPAAYYRRLAAEASSADVWETIYVHVLDGDDAVARWVEGSAARPFLDELGGDGDEFVREYEERLRPHYPPEPDGKTLFPFRRLFLVTTHR